MVTTSPQPNLAGAQATSVPASVLQPNPAVMKSDSTQILGGADGGNGSTGCGRNTGGRIGDNRRSNKPIMEKRRRARINNCLNELKALILDAMKKDPARHSKLEKADILEMTVKHLQTLQKQQHTINTVSDPLSMDRFRAGFAECAGEVKRFPHLEPDVKQSLLQYLAECLNQSCKLPEVPQVQVHILPAGAANPARRSPEQQVPQSSGIMQLVPTRLPNGDLALVLPASAAHHHPPLLVPIVPERSHSNVSAGTTSSYSSSQSPEPMDSTSLYDNAQQEQQLQQKPLSLVVRKTDRSEDNDEDEQPWRPWKN